MNEINELKAVLLLEKKLWTSDQEQYNNIIAEIMDILNRIVSHNPSSCSALINLGAIYSNLGDYTKAQELLEKAQTLNSQDRNLYLNLAYVSIYMQKSKRVYSKYFEIAKTRIAGEYTFEAYFDPLAH